VPPERAAADAAARADADAAADAALAAGVREGDRRAIAKAITLLESTRPDHRRRADRLLDSLLAATGRALRIGISGVPGVGKSTFIESLGTFLTGRGHRVAVLAVDPSSGISGGSILGDKTRMERLSTDERAYIRPTPSSGALGGVAERTREAMLVCEAAGYDVVLVETVGVGQSETAVAGMTDLFVLLQLPNAGDDLQAMKKGIMELADLVVINKADLDPDAAIRAEAQVTGALRVLRAGGAPLHDESVRWQVRVLRASAATGEGLEAFWDAVCEFRRLREASGEFAARRRRQSLAWLWDEVHARLGADFRAHPAVRAALPATLDDVEAARLAPSSGARRLLDLFEQPSRPA
jgi:LAO/AO transport system kinase